MILGMSTVAAAQQVAEYSMYDEFGEIMFNAPGKLLKNGGKKAIHMDGDSRPGEDFSNYRYRTDSFESTYNRSYNKEDDVLTAYKKDRYRTDKAWKFRPLDEEKDKKIIKIEDEPARLFQGNQMYRTPAVRPYMPMMPYSPMAPMAPMAPMVPVMPGLIYPYMPY